MDGVEIRSPTPRPTPTRSRPRPHSRPAPAAPRRRSKAAGATVSSTSYTNNVPTRAPRAFRAPPRSAPVADTQLARAPALREGHHPEHSAPLVDNARNVVKRAVRVGAGDDAAAGV